MEFLNGQSLITVIGFLLTGGVLAKAIEVFFIPKSKKVDVAAAVTQDLYEEHRRLTKDLSDLKKEFDEWKQKYWDLYENYKQLSFEATAQNNEQKKEIERLTKRVQELTGYKSQTQLINKLRKGLTQFATHQDKDKVIEIFKNELL